MKKFSSTDLLQQLAADTDKIIKTVKEDFAKLTEEQLNWKPAAEKWSVSECFRHLMLTSNIYFPKMENGIAAALQKNQLPTKNFRAGIIGNLMANSMRPTVAGEIKNKSKTFQVLDPLEAKNLSADIIIDFLNQQEQTKELLAQAKQVNLAKIRISSVGRLLHLKLGDALRFVIAHNQRHVLQAKKVTLLDNFPQQGKAI